MRIDFEKLSFIGLCIAFNVGMIAIVIATAVYVVEVNRSREKYNEKVAGRAARVMQSIDNETKRLAVDFLVSEMVVDDG